MIVDDIASVLPFLREQAESMMVDHCTITRLTGTTLDPVTLEEVPAYGPVWSGPCRVQIMDRVVPVSPDAAGREWSIEQIQLQLPVVGTDGIRIGDRALMDTGTNDADLIGRIYTVMMTHAKTHATSRRLGCEEVIS